MPDTEIIEGASKIEDPGQQEGVKQDPREAQENISPESPRFKEVYGKWKTSERELERLRKDVDDLKQGLSSKDTLIAEMRKWNEELAGSVKDSIETVGAAHKEDAVASRIEDLETSITVLKEDYTKALEDGKIKEASDINDKLVDVKLELRELRTKPKEKDKPKERSKGDVPPEMKPYVTFIENNPWYYDNPEMAAYALQIEQALNVNPKWMSKSVEDRLAEVKRITETKFDWKPEGKTGEATPRSRGVASVEAGTHSSSSATDVVKGLTPQELELCKGFDISPERFLAQKTLVQPRARRA